MLHYIEYMSIKKPMELIAMPLAIILWYLAYEAKPKRNDEIGSIWEKEYTNKRVRLSNLINEING